ncbi:MAG: hypothetical protein ABI233_01730 [Chthoniobacterales bacterium]
MNDFSELEADLKKLRPAPASDELCRRIERSLDLPNELPTAGVLPGMQTRARAGGWRSFAFGLLGVAALVVLGVTFFDQTPMTPKVAITSATPPVVATGFQPAGLSQVVYSGRDEGLVFPPNDSSPLRRRLRYETRETMRWRNAQTGASVRVTYPVEQVVLTPVAFQ